MQCQNLRLIPVEDHRQEAHLGCQSDPVMMSMLSDKLLHHALA
jgi:hypothetical protein